MARYWFRPKAQGIGAAPCSWEGWALAAGMVAAIVLEAALLPPRFGHGWSITLQAVTVALLLGLCRLKTEGEWRWRWEQDN